MPLPRGFLSDLPRQPFVRFIALLALVQTAGCYAYHPRKLPTPELTDPMTYQYRGQYLTLHRPSLEGDSVLVGWYEASGADAMVVSGRGQTHMERGDSVQVRLPLTVYDAEFREGATTLTVLGALTAMLVVICGALAPASCGPG